MQQHQQQVKVQQQQQMQQNGGSPNQSTDSALPQSSPGVYSQPQNQSGTSVIKQFPQQVGIPLHVRYRWLERNKVLD